MDLTEEIRDELLETITKSGINLKCIKWATYGIDIYDPNCLRDNCIIHIDFENQHHLSIWGYNGGPNATITIDDPDFFNKAVQAIIKLDEWNITQQTNFPHLNKEPKCTTIN